MKQNNYVAKYMEKFNKPKTYTSKKQYKRNEKHRNKYT